MYDIDDKEAAIRAIQHFLLELHYYEKRIPHITIDGIYGESTRNAVAAYQHLIGLPESGTVDYATWEHLYRDYTRARRQRESAERIPPDTPLPVSVGASGTGVRHLQELLNAIAERYGLGIRTDTSGIFSYSSDAVANAIRRIYKLSEDGTVNGELFEKMLRDYAYPAFRI